MSDEPSPNPDPWTYRFPTEQKPRNACGHHRLGFQSGGFYVHCVGCGSIWVALAPDRINDAGIDYTAGSDGVTMNDVRLSRDAARLPQDGSSQPTSQATPDGDKGAG